FFLHQMVPRCYSPLYVVFTILRLLVHLTFFVKTKYTIRYSFIWLLVMATSLADISYVLSLSERKTCYEEQPEEVIGLLITHERIIGMWVGVIVYWRMLNKTFGVSQMIKCAYNYCRPYLVFSLSILVVTTYRIEKVQPMDIFDDDTLTVCMCIGTTVGFLFMAWTSEAGKQPSFLMFGCLFTQLPFSSAFKAFVMSDFSDYMIFWSPIGEKALHIVIYGIVQVEAISVSRVIADTHDKDLLWPDLKGMGRPRDIETL
ncbi:hypothetical protein BJV82DRAFT_592012, partial [Fennellomyces sp. T-0311]